jgi:hypothetical protein
MGAEMSRVFCGGVPASERARLSIEKQRREFAAQIAQQQAIIAASLTQMKNLYVERQICGPARVQILQGEALRAKAMHTDALRQLERLRSQDATLERRAQLLESDINTVATASLLKKTDKLVVGRKEKSEIVAGIVSNATELDDDAVEARNDSDLAFAQSASEFDAQRNAPIVSGTASGIDIFEEIAAMMPTDPLHGPAVPYAPPSLTMPSVNYAAPTMSGTTTPAQTSTSTTTTAAQRKIAKPPLLNTEW